MGIVLGALVTYGYWTAGNNRGDGFLNGIAIIVIIGTVAFEWMCVAAIRMEHRNGSSKANRTDRK